MDTIAAIENSRTYVPVRYLAEAFDATVRWDGGTRTVHITSASNATPNTQPPKTTPPRDEAQYDKDGLMLAQHANAFYQQWFETLRITYEGDRVFISYRVPEGLPENTELVIMITGDLLDEKKGANSLWLYQSHELVAGHREAGRESGTDYLIPNPKSGEVKKELDYIPIEYFKWVNIGCRMGTPRGAVDVESQRYAQSSYNVNINTSNLKESELRIGAYDGRNVLISREINTIDGSAIVRYR